jgi:DinB superfamily
MQTDWLDEAFNGPAWHGPALLGALRGVTDAQAAWRPAPGRHSIRDIVLHAAYWKHVVRGRLTRTRERFAVAGHNWFPTGTPSFKEDLAVLKEEHRRLRDVVSALPERRASSRVNGRQTAAQNIRGIAAHDVYHAAQIQLLKKLAQQH